MQRLITDFLKTALRRKIVLLSGPRQVGKTTLAKSLSTSPAYYNYDLEAHRLMLRKMEWVRSSPLVIFDELHKMKSWKRWLKGIYDTEGVTTPLLVTGSARLDVAKKMGDSLAGRYLQFRLHPLCVKELLSDNPSLSSQLVMQDLLRFGGFPEPFLAKDPVIHGQWQATHLDIILRQDMLDTESLRDVIGIETLIELISSRVGSLVTYESLARDLERSASTIKRWLEVLENLYVLFSLRPYSNKIARSLRQARKYYLFDVSRVTNGEGAKFENLVALALKKECDRLQDCLGQKISLQFLHTKDDREVDFILKKAERTTLVECKLSDDSFSTDLKHFSQFFPKNSLSVFQVVANLKEEREVFQGPKMARAHSWLAKLPIFD
jgi:uncharacterized protein